MSAVPVDDLIKKLGSDVGAERKRARETLVDAGASVVPALIDAYRRGDRDHKWGASKALAEIADPRAAEVFIDALEHSDSGIRWIGSEGLAALGPAGVPPLLAALADPSDGKELTVWIRTGARRALRFMVEEDPALEESLQPLIDALDVQSSIAQIPGAVATLRREFKP